MVLSFLILLRCVVPAIYLLYELPVLSYHPICGVLAYFLLFLQRYTVQRAAPFTVSAPQPLSPGDRDKPPDLLPESVDSCETG